MNRYVIKVLMTALCVAAAASGVEGSSEVDSPLMFVTSGVENHPTVDVVPEPASIALLGVALSGLAFMLRRRK